MSTATTESPQQAARRLAAPAIRDGFRPDGLFAYTGADGAALFWRIRCKRPESGDKWIRPMHSNGHGFALGEPEFPDGKPLYRLHELASRPGEPVIVTEGENCADALAKLGLAATTSGGAGSADAADWSPLAGRDVVIWPDNDEPGERYAQAVAEKLRELGCAVRIIEAARLGLGPKGDAVDYLRDVHPGATAADVWALPVVDAEPPGNEPGADWPDPEPLRRPLPPALPYPVEALGSVLAGAARDLRRVVQSPVALCGQSVLAAASLAAQRLADIEIDGRRHPLSLWLITVAESGERKSATDTPALTVHRERERAGFERYRSKKLDHDAALAAYAAGKKAAESKGKTDAAAIRRELEHLGTPPEAPLLPHLIAAEPTLEGLHKLLLAGQGALGLFSDEGGQFFGGHAMNRDNGMKTAAGLSGLWDRGEADRVRSGDGALKLYGKRLALHLLVQPVVAERVLSDPLLAGQGFLARCLIAWPEGTAGTREYVAERIDDGAGMSRYNARMRELLDRAPRLYEGTQNELDPPALSLEDDAKALWVKAHDAIERRMSPNGEYSSIRPWASKAAEQILRVAGVLAIVEGRDAISRACVEAGAMLIEWHLSEAARLVGMAETPPDTCAAEAVLRWCKSHGRVQTYSRELIKDGPACVRNANDLHRVMALLERYGWALPIEGGAVLDGARRRHAWRIHPAAAEV